MVLGYTTKNNYLPHTRISNTTEIIDSNQLDIENNVFIGHFNFIDASGGLSIEEGCQVSNYVSILTHSSHIAIRLYGNQYIKYNGKHIGYLKDAVRIGKYTFIGPHSTIMPGANIGKGSIVSAYSYVKAGIYPDFSILAGNPAQIIGNTYDDIDKHYLEQNQYLKDLYNEWANK